MASELLKRSGRIKAAPGKQEPSQVRWPRPLLPSRITGKELKLFRRSVTRVNKCRKADRRSRTESRVTRSDDSASQ